MGDTCLPCSLFVTKDYANANYLSIAIAKNIYLSKSLASTTYLTISNASSNYLSKIIASSTYLSISDAATIYLSKVDAASLYLKNTTAVMTYVNFTSTQTITGTKTFNTLKFNGPIYDSSNSVGTYGQILSTTTTGVKWVDVSSASGDYLTTTDASNTYVNFTDNQTITGTKTFNTLKFNGPIYDSTNSFGTNGQILSTTTSGVKWIDMSSGDYITTTDASNTYVNFTSTQTITGTKTFNTLKLNGPIYDASNSFGTNGQILSTTTSGVKWIDMSSGDYITTTDASNTYQPITSMADYLKSVDASNLYLTKNSPTIINGPLTFPTYSSILYGSAGTFSIGSITNNVASSSGIRLPRYIDSVDLSDGIFIGYNHSAGYLRTNLAIVGDGEGSANSIYMNYIHPATSNTGTLYIGSELTSGSLTIGNSSMTGTITIYGSASLNTSPVSTDSSLKIATTAFVKDQNYLTPTSASSTYQTITGMASYLTTTSASSTYQTMTGMSSYLTTTSASSTYQTITGMSSYLTTADAINRFVDISSTQTITGSKTFTNQVEYETYAPHCDTLATQYNDLTTKAYVDALVGSNSGTGLNFYLDYSLLSDISGYYTLTTKYYYGESTSYATTPSSGTNLIAGFITDANIPYIYGSTINAGLFSLNLYAFVSTNTGTLNTQYTINKYDTLTSTITLLATSGNSSDINGTNSSAPDLYHMTCSFPTTSFLSTDRLLMLVYSVGSGMGGGATITTCYEGSYYSYIQTPISSGGDILLQDNSWTGTNAFSNTITAPTQETSNNSSNVATTAYVKNNLSSYLPTTTASSTYLSITTASSMYAPLASPTFTGSSIMPTLSVNNLYANSSAMNIGTNLSSGTLTIGSTTATTQTLSGTWIIPTLTNNIHNASATTSVMTIGTNLGSSGTLTIGSTTATTQTLSGTWIIPTLISDVYNANTSTSNMTIGTNISGGTISVGTSSSTINFNSPINISNMITLFTTTVTPPSSITILNTSGNGRYYSFGSIKFFVGNFRCTYAIATQTTGIISFTLPSSFFTSTIYSCSIGNTIASNTTIGFYTTVSNVSTTSCSFYINSSALPAVGNFIGISYFITGV